MLRSMSSITRKIGAPKLEASATLGAPKLEALATLGATKLEALGTFSLNVAKVFRPYIIMNHSLIIQKSI